MKYSVIILFLSISLVSPGQENRLKTIVDYADDLNAKNRTIHKMNAFILYDWYDDITLYFGKDRIAELNLPDVTDRRNELYNLIITDGSFSQAEKGLASALRYNGCVEVDCRDCLELEAPNWHYDDEGRPGSTIDFKAGQDIMLAYYLLSEEKRVALRDLVSEELSTKLLTLEEQYSINEMQDKFLNNELEIKTVESKVISKNLFPLPPTQEEAKELLVDFEFEKEIEVPTIPNQINQLDLRLSNAQQILDNSILIGDPQMSNQLKKRLERAAKNIDKALDNIEKARDNGLN